MKKPVRRRFRSLVETEQNNSTLDALDAKLKQLQLEIEAEKVRRVKTREAFADDRHERNDDTGRATQVQNFPGVGGRTATWFRRAAGPPVKLVDDQWYDARWLARFYDVHPITVFAWAKKGVISPGIKVGPNSTRWRGLTIREDLARKTAGKIYV